jgi:hypothetical protein
MKVKVKDIAVQYNGERHEKGQNLEIKKEHFNESLFEEVSSSDKKASKRKQDEE